MVGFVGEQLFIAPRTAAELMLRMVDAGLLKKSMAREGRYRLALTLTLRATALLQLLKKVRLEESSSSGA